MSPTPASAAGAEPARRPSRRRVVLGVAFAVALIAMVVSIRWWTHPTVIESGGWSSGSQRRPVAKSAVTATVIYPQVGGTPETLTLREVEGVFGQNSAGASATFSICHLSEGDELIGVVHDPERYCKDLEPFIPGATFDYGEWPEGDSLLVTITPTQPGVARLIGVNVDYATGVDHLFQRGNQRIRISLKTAAR